MLAPTQIRREAAIFPHNLISNSTGWYPNTKAVPIILEKVAPSQDEPKEDL